MNVEIISIGDELLIGQTVNTNASWIGLSLSNIGARIVKTTTISDQKKEIIDSLLELDEETQCVIITGGLGPTKDDITKHTLCDYFETSLEMHQPTLDKIKDFFAQRNRPMLNSNNQQAALPKSCTILENNYGTAAGMWFEKNQIVYISLPGVPYEMKGIMTEEVIPKLQSQFELKSMYFKTAMTQGIGESFLAELIKDWEDQVYSNGLSLAYLPSPGIVKLRLSSLKGKKDQKIIDGFFEQLETIIPQYLFGFNSDTLPSVIGNQLKERKLTIGTVESCTAGKLASEITQVSGSSSYYMGSLLTYSNQLKEKLANVSKSEMQEHGSVSEQVARSMAEGGRTKLNVDVCISTTGISGPTGGTEEKPVGMVWVAISTPKTTITRKFQFSQHRERNIHMTTLCALNLLRNNLDF
jgi:nicotinamide-nucleotide amidase